MRRTHGHVSGHGMIYALQCRRKSAELLKRAARTRDYVDRDKLLDESMLWSIKALAAERMLRSRGAAGPAERLSPL